jgi:hypothetical protein
MDTKITQAQEEKLQEIAHELENLAEELRNRARSGRSCDALEPLTARMHFYGDQVYRLAGIHAVARPPARAGEQREGFGH